MELLLGGASRYLLLETIREFALEQLRAEGEEDQLRQRHYAAFLQLFRTADSRLRGPEAAAWLARLEPEQDNLRAALRWTLDEGRYADMAWLLLAVAWFWYHIGHWYELGKWISQLLSHREVLDIDVRLAIVISLHPVAHASEEFQPIDRLTAEMLGLLEVCSDKLLQASAWYFVAVFSADLADSAGAFERSIACARAARDRPGLGPQFGILSDRDFVLGDSLWAYADRLIEQGEFAQAAPLLAESSKLLQTQGSRWEMAASLGTAGRLALLQGDLTKSHALLHEAVTLASSFNHQGKVGDLQPFLGIVTLYGGGDAPEARRLLEDSLRLCLDLNDRFFLGRVCTYLAETALWEGELAEADQWLVQSLTYQADPRRIRIDQVERLLVAARLATAQGAYLRAATLFGVAERVRSQIRYEPAGPVRRLADTALATVRASLDPPRFAEAFSAGQQLSLEEAFAAFSASSSVTGAPPLLSQLSA